MTRFRRSFFFLFRRGTLAAVLAAGLGAALPFAPARAGEKVRVRPQGSPGDGFACYYGLGRLEELKKFRVVVLRPSSYNPSDIAELRKSGVIVLAFLSLGGDDALRRGNGRGPGGWADWYVDEFTGDGTSVPGPDHQPDRGEGEGPYFVDPSRASWKKHVRREAKRLKEEFGFDGLLLDALGLPRNVYRTETERRMVAGMHGLLASLRGDWRRGYFLGGSAWDFLGQRKILDGILMENLYSEDLEDFEKIGRLVKGHRNSRPLDAYLLEAVPPRMAGQADRVCRAVYPYGFAVSIYRDDPEGRARTSFPWRTCGSPAAASIP